MRKKASCWEVSLGVHCACQRTGLEKIGIQLKGVRNYFLHPLAGLWGAQVQGTVGLFAPVCARSEPDFQEVDRV